MDKKKAENNTKRIGLMFHNIYGKIDSNIEDETLQKELKKDIEKIQKELKIKSISDKEIEILKDFGLIQ